MLAIKLIAEGLGLGFLLYLICAIGVRNGAIGSSLGSTFVGQLIQREEAGDEPPRKAAANQDHYRPYRMDR